MRRCLCAFLAVVLLAGCLRAWVARTCETSPIPIQGDSQILNGLHSAPLFPLVLSWLGPGIRWFNVALGAATSGCWFLIAWLMLQRWNMALMVGCLAAIHPFWILNVVETGDGVMATFLLAAALTLGLHGAREGGVFTSLFFGLALALLSLTRAGLLLFAWLALIWYLGKCRPKQQGYVYALLAVVGFFGGMMPWIVENLMKHGDVFPVVDSTYHHLWLGTTTHPADPPETVAELRRDFLEQIQSNPGDFLRRRVLAVSDFLIGREWAERPWPNGGAWGILLGVSSLAMLVGGLFGWRWSFDQHRETWPLLAPLVLIPLPYILGHGERWLGPRLPWDGMILVFVGYALTTIGRARPPLGN